jgi:hypothetical protein
LVGKLGYNDTPSGGHQHRDTQAWFQLNTNDRS